MTVSECFIRYELTLTCMIMQKILGVAENVGRFAIFVAWH